MEQEPDREIRSRNDTLTIALVLIAGGSMLFFLYLISLGIVGNVLAAGAIFVVVGCLHYLVWGKSMSQEVAREREAVRRQEKLDPAAPPAPWQEASDAIQDLSVTKSVKKGDDPHTP